MSLPASEGHLILDVRDNPLSAPSQSSAKRHWVIPSFRPSIASTDVGGSAKRVSTVWQKR